MSGLSTTGPPRAARPVSPYWGITSVNHPCVRRLTGATAHTERAVDQLDPVAPPRFRPTPSLIPSAPSVSQGFRCQQRGDGRTLLGPRCGRLKGDPKNHFSCDLAVTSAWSGSSSLVWSLMATGPVLDFSPVGFVFVRAGSVSDAVREAGGSVPTSTGTGRPRVASSSVLDGPPGVAASGDQLGLVGRPMPSHSCTMVVVIGVSFRPRPR